MLKQSLLLVSGWMLFAFTPFLHLQGIITETVGNSWSQTERLGEARGLSTRQEGTVTYCSGQANCADSSNQGSNTAVLWLIFNNFIFSINTSPISISIFPIWFDGKWLFQRCLDTKIIWLVLGCSFHLIFFYILQIKELYCFWGQKQSYLQVNTDTILLVSAGCRFT